MKLLAHSRSLLVVTAFAALAVGCSSKSNNSVNAKGAAIIGGTEVTEGSALQQSIVGIYDVNKHALCTGSLLENNIVLTAAHCIGAKPQDHVIIFAADLEAVFNSQDRNLVLQKVRRAVNTVVNPNWGKKHATAGEAWGDTALIKFSGTVPAGFQPASFLADNNLLTEGTMITVAGYGVNSDILTPVNKADYPDFSDRVAKGEFFCETAEDGKTETCYKEDLSGEAHLRTTDLTVAGSYNSTEIVFDQQHGHASCEGDSGGPAYIKDAQGNYKLFGVTSRGTRGCNGYVVYSQISSPDLQAWLKTALVKVAEVPAAPAATQPVAQAGN